MVQRREEKPTKTKQRIIESIEQRLVRLVGEDAEILEEEDNINILSIELESLLNKLIKKDTLWFERMKSEYNLKFSFDSLDKELKVFIAKTAKDTLFAIKIKPVIRQIATIYFDLVQEKKQKSIYVLNGPRLDAAIEAHWNSYIKLYYIMKKLGINTSRDRKMYILGVDQKKCRRIYNKSIPRKILASPYCILDFLIYLKEVWYERHIGHPGVKWEPQYKERAFGQTYYQKLASQALGFLRDTIKRNRGSVFSSEIPSSLGLGAEDDFWAYYIFSCSKVTRVFWERGWLKELNPKISNKVDALKNSASKDKKLSFLLKLTKKKAEEIWKTAALPMYGANDEFHLLWTVGNNKQLQKEISTWMRK